MTVNDDNAQASVAVRVALSSRLVSRVLGQEKAGCVLERGEGGRARAASKQSGRPAILVVVQLEVHAIADFVVGQGDVVLVDRVPVEGDAGVRKSQQANDNRRRKHAQNYTTHDHSTQRRKSGRVKGTNHFWMRIFSALVPVCAATIFLSWPTVSFELHHK
jgi:predicted metalloprotease